ncbi:MAG TPA: flagellar protein FliT [Burkholderiaceae bacterium]
MTGEQAIHAFETVSALTSDMLAAARGGQWDRLAALEADSARQVALLRDGDVPALAAPLRARAASVIRATLDCEAEVRALIHAKMQSLLAELDHATAELNSAGTERKLANAYGKV